MTVRVRFSKFGRLRFLGHLDVLRFVQKCFARSGLPIAYSEGFHPHMLISFAQPLSLSMTSDGEYFDCEMTEPVPPDEIKNRLNEVLCDGFYIQSVSVLPERGPNERKITGMSQIAGAMYLCRCDREIADIVDAGLRKLAASDSYIMEKQAKNGMKEVDVRAGIHAVGIVHEDGNIEYPVRDNQFEVPESLTDGFGRAHSEHAENPDGCYSIVLCLDAGSENNISTDLIAAALNHICNTDYERMFLSHRMELYGKKDGTMVPLEILNQR